MIESARTLWDEWFDAQYDLVECVERAVRAQCEGKPPLFKAAVYAGLMEHCAEAIRSSIDMEVPEGPAPVTQPDLEAEL